MQVYVLCIVYVLQNKTKKFILCRDICFGMLWLGENESSCWGQCPVQWDMREGEITLVNYPNAHVNVAASPGPGKLSFIKWVRADLCSDVSCSRLRGHCTPHSRIMMNLLLSSLAGRLNTAVCSLGRERDTQMLFFAGLANALMHAAFCRKPLLNSIETIEKAEKNCDLL